MDYNPKLLYLQQIKITNKMIQRTLQNIINSNFFKGKAIIIIGARQVGKSTLMHQVIDEFNKANPNVQRTANGYEVINTPTFTSPEVGSNLPQPQAKKKAVAKKGGRFKK